MMTALSVRIPEKQRGIKALAEKLRRDKIEITMKRARGVSLRHIVYTSYSGEVKLEKTDDAVGIQRDRLLCSDKLSFPPSSGYKRFCSTAFSARLCENFALSVLSDCRCAADLRIAVYDPAAYSAGLLIPLLERCSDVTVVTDCAQPYFCAADRALNELGAGAMITRRREELASKDLIIAPKTISETLNLDSDAVVLTVKPPVKPISGAVFYNYHFKMPNGFADIKPEELSEEYFCSALYTLGAQFALGSIVPLTAACGSARKTAAEVGNLLAESRC